MSQYYLRINVKNEPGVLEQVSLQFAEQAISIEKIIQKESDTNIAEIVIITNTIEHQNFIEVETALSNLKQCNKVESSIRLYKTL